MKKFVFLILLISLTPPVHSQQIFDGSRLLIDPLSEETNDELREQKRDEIALGISVNILFPGWGDYEIGNTRAWLVFFTWSFINTTILIGACYSWFDSFLHAGFKETPESQLGDTLMDMVDTAADL